MLGLLVAAGCGKPDGTGGPKDSSATATSAERLSGKGSLPEGLFTGIIEGRQWEGSSALAVTVTYWIGSDRIKREVIPATRVGKVISSSEISGVILNPGGDNVTLYRSAGGKKHYVNMTLPQYDEFCQVMASVSVLNSCGVGTIFVGLQDEKYLARNSSNAVAVQGYACDRLLINFGSLVVTVIEADHCPTIKVSRDLLGRVELSLPVEVTGFPLQVRKVQVLRSVSKSAGAKEGKLAELLARGAELVSEGLEKVTEAKLEVVRIAATELASSQFEQPPGFTKLPDVETFVQAFLPPKSSGSHSHSWDDWD